MSTNVLAALLGLMIKEDLVNGMIAAFFYFHFLGGFWTTNTFVHHMSTIYPPVTYPVDPFPFLHRG